MQQTTHPALAWKMAGAAAGNNEAALPEMGVLGWEPQRS